MVKASSEGEGNGYKNEGDHNTHEFSPAGLIRTLSVAANRVFDQLKRGHPMLSGSVELARVGFSLAPSCPQARRAASLITCRFRF
jgi:hypothetical protein